MGSMFLAAEFFGRQKTSIVALTFAAAVMVGIEPGILRDVSFQLSFLSISGLIFIYPYFRKLLNAGKNNEPASFVMGGLNAVADSFLVTLSAILATLPVIAYNFGTISLFGLPATVFILPVLPVIIGATALVCLTGLFAPWLAQVIGWIDWLFLSYFILIIQIFNSLPVASLKLKTLQLWQVWGYYLLAISILLGLNFRKYLVKFISYLIIKIKPAANSIYAFSQQPFFKWLIPSVFTLTILVWVVVFTLPDNNLHVSVLDVGQGEAILIQTPDHRNILIDGGPSAQDIRLELSKKLSFWNRNIDLAVISQPQADHITGLLTVVNDYKIGEVLSSPDFVDSEIFRQLNTAIKAKNIGSQIIYAGDVIDLGNNLKIETLHPPQGLYQSKSSDPNCNSLVLRLSWNKISFLLTSDIDAEVENYLINERSDIQSTVLLVAHHGSKTSSSDEFLTRVDAQTAVISVGADNRYGHPDPETMSRLGQQVDSGNIFLTSKNGSVEFITNGIRLWVKTDTVK